MAYPLITEYNLSAGPHVLFLYMNDIVPNLFIPFFFLSIWSIVTLGSYFAQVRLYNRGDLPMSLALSGFAMISLNIVLNMIYDGIVGKSTSTIIFAVGIISILWFLLDSKGDSS